MTAPIDPEELPARLVERLDELDRQLPPVARWRAAAPVPGAVAPDGRLERVRGRLARRPAASTAARSRVPAALVAAIALAAVGLGLWTGPGRPAPADLAVAPGSSPPPGASASPAATVPAGVSASAPAPVASAPNEPAASAEASRPASEAPTPRSFRELKTVPAEGTVEAELSRSFGWACPVRVPPAGTPNELEVTARLPGASGATLKLRDGGILFVGRDPERVALTARATLVIVDADGELWLVMGSERTVVQRLAPLVVDGVTLGWWLADVVVPAKCPQPTAAG